CCCSTPRAGARPTPACACGRRRCCRSCASISKPPASCRWWRSRARSPEPPARARGRAGGGRVSLALLLLGAVLVLLALVDQPGRRLPMTPALLYLGVGWTAGISLDAPGVGTLVEYALPLRFLIEFALLVSLVAIGLRLRVPPTPGAWRVALFLAGP